MSKIQRAQVSLVFTDNQLYDDFIDELKQRRELNAMILKCLTAYYYSQEVRRVIDNYGEEENIHTSEIHISESQQIIDNIRNSLALDSYYADELQNVIDNGTQMINDIMDGVDIKKKESGFVSPTTTEYGNGVPTINIGIGKNNQSNESSTGGTVLPVPNSPSSIDMGVIGSLIEQMNLIATAVKTIEGRLNLAPLEVDFSNIISGNSNAETKNAILETKTEESISKNNTNEYLDAEPSNKDLGISDSEETDSDINRLGEAKNAMLSLLSSI